MTHLHGITAESRSTGWRDISALMSGIASGQLRLCRTGATVWLSLDGLVPGTLTSGGTIATLPAGFWPSLRVDWRQPASGGAPAFRTAFILTNGGFGVWAPSTSDAYLGMVSFPCAQPMPTVASLPGTQITPPNYT